MQKSLCIAADAGVDVRLLIPAVPDHKAVYTVAETYWGELLRHDIDEAILLSDRIYLLTGQPGRITEEIAIREPRPRPEGFNLTPEFLAYKKHILEKL